MRAQEIIKENGIEYLVVSVPVPKEVFSDGFTSKSGKSLVYQACLLSTGKYTGYCNIRLDPSLIKDKSIAQQFFQEYSIISHPFNGIMLPCVKIKLNQLTNG